MYECITGQWTVLEINMIQMVSAHSVFLSLSNPKTTVETRFLEPAVEKEIISRNRELLQAN